MQCCCCFCYNYVAASVSICVYVSIMVFDIVADNCCHCSSVYVTVTACNVAYAALPFLKGNVIAQGDGKSLTSQYFSPDFILQ